MRGQCKKKIKFFIKLLFCPLVTLGTDVAGWIMNIYTTANYLSQPNRQGWGFAMLVIIFISSILSLIFCSIRLCYRKEDYPFLWKNRKRQCLVSILFFLGLAETLYALDIVVGRVRYFRAKIAAEVFVIDDKSNKEDAKFFESEEKKHVEICVVKILQKYSRNVWTALIHGNYLINFIAFDVNSFCLPKRDALENWTGSRALLGNLARNENGKVRVQYPVDCSCERKGQLHEILTAVLDMMVVRLFKRMYHKC